MSTKHHQERPTIDKIREHHADGTYDHPADDAIEVLVETIDELVDELIGFGIEPTKTETSETNT